MKVIFIPGLLCTSEVWGLTNELRKKYDCYDADISNNDTIEGIADAIIEQFGNNNLALIGISMGGYIAIDVALKLKNKVKYLILICTTAKEVNKDTIADRNRAIELAKHNKLDEILKMSDGMCFSSQKKEYKEIEKRMAEEIGCKAYISQQRAIMSRNDYTKSIGSLECKTLVISSKDDRVLSYKDSIEIFEKIEKANILIFHKGGHLPTIEESKTTYYYIDKFLDGSDTV